MLHHSWPKRCGPCPAPLTQRRQLLAQVVSEYFGESEAGLRGIFAAAAALQPSVCRPGCLPPGATAWFRQLGHAALLACVVPECMSSSACRSSRHKHVLPAHPPSLTAHLTAQVIFIDELDALAPSRGGGLGGGKASNGGGSSARVVTTLLTEMDALGGEPGWPLACNCCA